MKTRQRVFAQVTHGSIMEGIRVTKDIGCLATVDIDMKLLGCDPSFYANRYDVMELEVLSVTKDEVIVAYENTEVAMPRQYAKLVLRYERLAE